MSTDLRFIFVALGFTAFAAGAAVQAAAPVEEASAAVAARAEADDDATAGTAIAAQEDFRWRGRLAPGRQVEIKGTNGRVRAVAATGDVVDVQASKRARRSDPDEVRIDVVEHDDGVTICAVYPTPRGRRPNECAPGDAGRNNVNDNDVRVAFVVEVPAGIAFAGRTVNGDVDVGRLDGPVTARTVNGSVRIDRAWRASARTVNGSITAVLTDAEWSEPAEFETVNGSITLDLPDSIGAELRIRTVNGRIETDFPLRVQGRFNARRLNGAIGGGGPELRLRTVNGAIRLRSSPAPAGT